MTRGSLSIQLPPNFQPSVPEQQRTQELIDAIDEGSAAMPPSPATANTTTGARKPRRAGQGTIEAFQQAVQNVQPATVTPNVHAYPGQLMGIHRGRLLRGSGDRVSVHIQRKTGSCKDSLPIPYQRLRRYPRCEYFAHARFPSV